MKNILNFAVLLCFAIASTSCTKNDNFSAGWDDRSIETTITLDPESAEDIVLGDLDIYSNTQTYLNANNHDLKSYQMIEVRPTWGSVISSDLMPLAFVESLDVYAVKDGSEQLIAMISSGSSQDPSLSLAGIDVNILDLSEEDVQIVIRPQYNDLATIADGQKVEASMSFSYRLSGRK